MEKISNEKLKETAIEIRSLISSHTGKLTDYAYVYLRLIVHQEEMSALAKGFNQTLEQALKTQCLYALNNLTAWRHPKAKELRQILKDYVAQN